VGARDLGLWLLAGLTLVGLLATVAMWWQLRSTIDRKNEEIAAAEREVAELAPIIAEVERFKLSKAELERKIGIINDLKANQRGPVRIMDAVSRALPELLWLNRMDARQNQVTIAGEALNPNAVANFLENLDDVPEFQEPILKDITQRATQQADTTYTFTINFTYTHQPPAAAAEQPASGGGG
jgi:type IV pilus assembly protein PilN